MYKKLLIAFSITGFLAVALGAFGAHGLKPFLDEHQTAIYEKGVYYQFFHTLAALFALLYFKVSDNRKMLTVALLFLLGIICFSGSLYLLATHDLNHIPTIILGPVTPLGGLFFLAGWVTLFLTAFQEKQHE